MFGSDVDATVKPADRPSVEVETVEHGPVAQRGKELVLLNEWQAVEDALTAIIEGQVQPIAIKGTGGCNPFLRICQLANLWYIVIAFNSLAAKLQNLFLNHTIWPMLFTYSWRKSHCFE